MILIFSQLRNDMSTDDVIDWIEHLGGGFVRLNNADFDKMEFSYTVDESATTGSEGQFDDVNSVWFRRWYAVDYSFCEDLNDNMLSYYAMRRFLSNESDSASGLLFRSLKDKAWVSDPFNLSPNKIKMLHLAVSLGLKIPATLVTNTKEKLNSFYKTHEKLICKPITDSSRFEYDETVYQMLTAAIDDELINALPETFPHSLFQAQIEKALEVRSFFFDNAFYSMAIFSSANSKTEVDFRNYDFEKPNRTVPYQLPEEVEKKLTQLMKELDLDTGSIDIIVTPDDDFYFLEVNPVGQFAMVSQPCNFNLEKIIAEKLIENDHI
jgi:ATP-GRASP peptide maturase of grasp-with-spasm system